ncbi:MAG: hypothetical protein UR27_C0001G0066 [Candidatus Peregrinibacteria bacterium GW2011_GWA2_33_10]|nr:MAG: hypothetical protein UR27_C0001G0066 [Candidatus Peregrinibacteria bacterium GW2011_GWA2_33_10]KKP39795.1 MAG: ATP-dependent Clp protease ATP-binding subunit ClpC, ATP-dependent Clp protease ATP-binding subunit ClpC [Candidatus Peregrinibacteria bacterium GW2011_GWC2_33_13]OGJ49058.1 MAG: hypothetical protein A2229_04465 [Candidatus Peregrinibacteria bacterium RIFOXYA2_FULL_33_7]
MENNNLYSQDIYKVLELAQNSAKSRNASATTSSDIFLGLLMHENELIKLILKDLKISQNQLIAEVKKLNEENKSFFNLNSSKNSEIPYHQETKRYFDKARELSQKYEDLLTSSEHLFLAMASISDETSNIGKIFKNFDIKADKVFSVFENIIKSQGTKTPFLDKFGRDITAKAKLGQLNPVIGRFAEIETIIHILSRKGKNNPLIYGDPGVGKTAIVEGIAQRIVTGNIPKNLLNKRIIELSLNSIIAGAAKRGEYEERLEKIINEVNQSNKSIILFIDEIHTIIKSEGADDAANILKPALARGEIQTIGATTIKEYRQYFEKDAALERRFQLVLLSEPDIESAFFIVKGLRDNYEKFHDIQIPDECLYESVVLSSRYIHNRFLPDKALDLIDEACAVSKTPRLSASSEIVSLESAKEFYASKAKIAEKNDNTVLYNNFLQKIAETDSKIIKLKEEMRDNRNEKVLDLSVIKRVVARMSKIPVAFLDQKDNERILHCGEFLKSKVIGQEEAVKSIQAALIRNVSGLKNKDRPIGSFVFLGPTGVGKTELAEVLAMYLFGSKDSLVRFDMSEFSEKHASAKLIGAPPGYIGYEEGGQLTECIRNRPYSVILFDEIEKAHPQIFDLLLQILDEGHLTDNQGHNVNFKNTIIICTSNIRPQNLNSETLKDQKKKVIVDALKAFLRLETVNRFDDLVYFNNLNLSDIVKILDIVLKDTFEALSSRNIALSLTEEAKLNLAKLGFDPELGARPLRYAVSEYIETPLAQAIAENTIKEGERVLCDFKGDEFVFVKE